TYLIVMRGKNLFGCSGLFIAEWLWQLSFSVAVRESVYSKGRISMVSIERLVNQRAALLQKLTRTGDMRPGSISENYRRCLRGLRSPGTWAVLCLYEKSRWQNAHRKFTSGTEVVEA